MRIVFLKFFQRSTEEKLDWKSFKRSAALEKNRPCILKCIRECILCLPITLSSSILICHQLRQTCTCLHRASLPQPCFHLTTYFQVKWPQPDPYLRYFIFAQNSFVDVFLGPSPILICLTSWHIFTSLFVLFANMKEPNDHN